MQDQFIGNVNIENGIQWESLNSRGIIDINETLMIKNLVQSPNTQIIALRAYGVNYCKIFLKLMNHLKSMEYIRVIISLIDSYIDILSTILIGLSKEFTPFETFMNYIRVDDENFFVKAKAINIIGSMLAQNTNREFIRTHVQSVIRWTLRDLEKVQNLDDLDCMMKSFKSIVRFREGRSFLMSINGIAILEKFYEVPHDDIVYNTLFCVWLLSYHDQTVNQILHPSIQKIVNTIKSTRTQRIIRIGIGALRNLVELNKNREYMFECDLIKVFPRFVSLKYEDPEFKANLEYLQKKLEQTRDHMISWFVYKDRILSGNLKRSIMHKDEAFWKALISYFGDNNFEVIDALLTIINGSDPEKVAVALYHIKYFLKYHPASHRILNLNPDIKIQLMAKLDDPNPKVQLEALFAVQKLVIVH